MLNLYEEYASQEERESAVMLENAEIAMDRALLSLNTCCAMQELDMRAAEARLVLECGGVENLMEYYEDAAENTADKKEGLFTKVWNAILKFLENIKNALFGKKIEANPNDEVEVEQTWLDRHEKIKKAVDSVKRAVANPVVATVGAAIVACGAVATVKAVDKKRKMKVSDVEKIKKEEEAATTELMVVVENAAKKTIGSQLQDKWKEFQSFVSGLSKQIQKNYTNFMDTHVPERKREVLKKAAKDGIAEDRATAAAEKRWRAGNATKEDEALLKKAGFFESVEDDFSDEDDFFGESAEVDEIAELLATL